MLITIPQETVKKICEMFMEGYTYREIGDQVELPANQIGRIIQKLRNSGADLPFRINNTKGLAIAKSVREFMSGEKHA